MQSVLRNIVLGIAALAFAVSTSSVARADSTDPKIGTWTLNLEKSKFSPGPPLKSLTITFEPAGKGIHLTTKGVGADGTASATEYTANYDGKDYPLTGSPTANTVALKRINAYTTSRIDKKDGKVVSTLRATLSKDAKTYTVTVKGKTAKGEPLANTLVFNKQS
jgi:hypothetical protein